MPPKGYGKYAQIQRERARRSGMPKGFDITLADAIAHLNLNEDQIKHLGQITANKEIAHAVVGHQVYYRKGQLERMFGGV